MSGADAPNGSVAPGPDYEWMYEYYEDEPVSYEGLTAHRYSVVIGFWVGLAVFVIFMFVLLTHLTKTGATRPDSRPCQKRPRLIGYMDTTVNSVAPPTQPRGVVWSCSLLHCHGSTQAQLSSIAQGTTAAGGGGVCCHTMPSGSVQGEGSTLLQELAVSANRLEKEEAAILLLDQSIIPNCVNPDQSSDVGGEHGLRMGEQQQPGIEGRQEA